MKQVKILFELGSDAWGGYSTETLWANKVKDGFVIDNYPFFVRKICYGDLVEAENIADALFVYKKTLKKSKHSLYRIAYDKSGNSQTEVLLAQMKELGASYEKGVFDTIVMVALDIPEFVDIDLIWNILEEGCENNYWNVEEGDDRHV